MGFAGSKQTLFFTQVDNSLKFGEGGGVEGEKIEVVSIHEKDIREFIFDESKPKTSGFMFSIEWFFLNKRQAQQNWIKS